MALAQIGPLTAVTEALATAVGAGAVLLGIAAGIQALIWEASRDDVEWSALVGGYVGGAAGAALALVDFILRYAP